MSSFIDSHCHLNHSSFEQDLTQVLQRAIDEGITQFIVPGTRFDQWGNQQQLKQKYPNIYLAYGIHPWFCDLHHTKHLEQLDTLLHDAIAVGECGLDTSPNKPSLEKQTFWFEAQLTLAEKHDLPVIVHSVKATHLILTSLKKHPQTHGVIHGFTGNIQQAESLIQCGYLIGIGTRLVQANTKKTQALLQQLPLEYMILETDAPDGMGKHIRNEPKALILVANIIAQIRQTNANNILDICSKNTRELFQL